MSADALPILDETHTCYCVGQFDDPQTETLRGLVAGGMGQWEASRMLWAPITGEVERTERGLGDARRSDVGPSATAQENAA